MADNTKINGFNWTTNGSFISFSWVNQRGRLIEKTVHRSAVSIDTKAATGEEDPNNPSTLTFKIFGEPVIVFTSSNVSAFTNEGAPDILGLDSAFRYLLS